MEGKAKEICEAPALCYIAAAPGQYVPRVSRPVPGTNTRYQHLVKYSTYYLIRYFFESRAAYVATQWIMSLLLVR